MAEQNESILNNLRDVQSLRGFLKSEMSVDDSGEKEAIARIKVYNSAPLSSDFGDVVFLGVGLRIKIGSERGGQIGSNYWPSRIRMLTESDLHEVRQKYNEGTWYGGTNRFPDVTSDERSHGAVLFPGESVIFEVKIPKADLSYVDVRMEGSVSRRHLLHISQPLHGFKTWTQPALIKTLKDLNEVDIYPPLMAVVNAIPEITPNTTLSDIEALRMIVEKAKTYVEVVFPKLNAVYHSAPNQEFRDYLKQGVGQYLTLNYKNVCQYAGSAF